jgi:hypothetical protein
LISRAEDQVDDDVGRKAVKLVLMVRKMIPLSLNVSYLGGKRFFARTAMQNSEVVASTMEFGDQRCSDEAVAADEKNLHASTTGGDALAPST